MIKFPICWFIIKNTSLISNDWLGINCSSNWTSSIDFRLDGMDILRCFTVFSNCNVRILINWHTFSSVLFESIACSANIYWSAFKVFFSLFTRSFLRLFGTRFVRQASIEWDSTTLINPSICWESISSVTWTCLATIQNILNW